MAGPPAAALRWVAATLGARVLGHAPLPGGADASMHRVTVAGRAGASYDVVLRLPRFAWDDVTTTAATLAAVHGAGVSAPEPLGVDPTGEHAGAPALLMTLLPGETSLPAEPSAAWLHSLAEQLHHVHAVAADRLPGLLDRVDRAVARLRSSDGRLPGESEAPPAPGPDFAAVHEVLRADPASLDPGGPRVLTHGDLWAGNTLRAGDTVVGVVDWGMAAAGVPAVDVAYCALDLSLCFDLPVGEAFIAAYADVAGVGVGEAGGARTGALDAWRRHSWLRTEWLAEWVPAWQELGRPVTFEEVAARRTAYGARLLDPDAPVRLDA